LAQRKYRPQGVNGFFYQVDFVRDGNKFVRPKWNQLDKSTVDNLIKI